MSQPDTAIELCSDTESEDGLRDHLAAGFRSADDSDDGVLHAPTRLAARGMSDRSGTPVARTAMSATTQTKRKADAAPLTPAFHDEDDSDGAAPSTAGVVCTPRAPPAPPFSLSVARAAMSATTQTKRKADAAPLTPAFHDEDDSDGAAPSTSGVVCSPRAPPAPLISSPSGRHARRGEATASSQQDFDEAVVANDAGAAPSTSGVLCSPRAPPAPLIRSPSGRHARRGEATASSQQDFDEAVVANDADADDAARVDPSGVSEPRKRRVIVVHV